MKKYLLSLGLSFLTIFLIAQRPGGMPQQQGGGKMPSITGRVYGKIIDATTKKPVEFASVVALRPMGRRDSILGGGLTLENGEFNIENLPIGGIKIKVSLIGYKDFIKQNVILMPPNDMEIDLGDITFQPDVKVLGEVEVTAQKSQMQLNLDKKVFNVDKNITASGGTAEDVLKNVPSVTVDADGAPKLRNNNTTVYVDGKPTVMSLNQIPADQIESVEVISNPSAKYEAATTGGIINIVLKKNKKPGYNGFVSAGIGTQNRYNGMINLNVKEGRTNWSGFYNINAANSPTNAYTYRTNLDATNGSVLGYFNQNTQTTFNNRFQIGRLAMDYNINNRNTLTIGGIYVNGRFNVSANQNYDLLTSTKSLLGSGTRIVEPRNEFHNYMIQASWKRTYPKKGKELTVDFNYGFGNSANTQIWNTTGKDATGATLTGYPISTDIKGENDGKQFTFQMDFTNPINDSTKLEMGLRSVVNDRTQEFLYYEKKATDASYTFYPSFSQDADVFDMNSGAYITYSSKWKGIAYQAGLRYEPSKLDGQSNLAGQSNFGYDYWDIKTAVFPSVYFSKKLNKKEEVQLNLSRKINRPNFMQLMPVIMGNDLQNVRQGNPALRPEFIHLSEFNYNKLFGQNNWLASAYFRLEDDPIVLFSEKSVDNPSVTRTTFINGKTAFRYGLDNTLKMQIVKDLDLTTNINIFNLKVETDQFKNEGFAWNGKANFNWKLPKKLKDFSMQLSGSYESDQVTPQGERKAIYFMDYALKYTFMRVASVTFQVNDITNSRREILFLNLPDVQQESMRRRDLRFYRITFQMPFGKMDGSIFRKAKDAQRQNQNQQNQQMDFGGQ